jgi:abortive infection bacteriophage resistance protein
MKYKELKKENKQYAKALGVANRTVCLQIDEISALNNICEMNEKYYNKEIERLNNIIEYLEDRK